MTPTTIILQAAIAATLLSVTQPATSHPAGFALEQVMQTPYPSSLTASPSGKAVAWVFDTQGRRNIWVADPDHGMKGRQITTFMQDDGFDIGDLAWSADEKSVAFTRGETLEDELPANVTSSPEGPAAREIWVVSTSASAGEAHKVAVGHAASFSPDGGRLVFIDKDRILTTPVNADPAAVRPLIVDKGNISSTLWSPDGKRLAFVSDRGSHSLVGVYDFAAGSITWLSPSLDRDTSPAFSPNGARIAFVRIPWEKGPEIVSHRSGQPWSIRVADVTTGQGRRVWVADAGTGSVFNSTLTAQNLLWTAHDQLVFPWEKSGWLQLYTVPRTEERRER